MLPDNQTLAHPDHPALAAAPGRLVRLLADDLTGACDAGAAFLKAGYSVRVWLGPTALFPAPEPAQAFHTASRSLPAEEAANAVSRAAASLQSGPGTVLFKKVDSAGRGPLAAEVLAAQQALGTRAILLAPAFPAAGRTVCNGMLQIRDECGQDRLVDLREFFAADMREAIAVVSESSGIEAAIEGGARVLICDSATQDDLCALARAAESLQGVLYAGSAGLAQAIAGLHPVPAQPLPTAAAARTLVVAGSEHPVTARQLAVLEQAVQMRNDVQMLRIACQSGDDAMVRAVFGALEPEALILTGGDTAQLAAEALGAHSIRLCGEFAPGIPWGRLQGGAAEGRIVVTKSGGFGSPTALYDVIMKLSGVL